MFKHLKAESAEQVARFYHKDAEIELYDEGRVAFARYELNDKPCAAAYRKSFKALWDYRFQSVERREAKIAECKQQEHQVRLSADMQKRKRSDATAAFVNPYKVGDILYNSWGYDQTNIGFYQVVETFGKRGVLLRELCQQTVPGSEGFMCEHVVPVPNNFAQKAVYTECDSSGHCSFAGYVDKEPLRKMVSNEGYVNIYGHDYGYARLWDGQSKYQSHYA